MRTLGLFHVTDGQDIIREQLENDFQQYCRLNSHQPIETFISDSKQRGPTDSGYKQMTEYVKTSGSEYLVVIPSASSLGQDIEAIVRSIIELEAMGLKVICWDDDFPDPLQNALQTLGVKGISRTRSAKIKESMSARAMRGQALGRPPYGYRIGTNGTLEIVADEVPVVELIYKLYTKNRFGLRLIARELNEREIPTRRGGAWSVIGIRDILKNTTYIGTYNRFGIRRPSMHEGIITAETFRAAQAIKKERKPLGRIVDAEPFLLSGIIYCKYCGNKMMGVTRKQSWKGKDGRRTKKVYRYYQCQSRNNQSTCGYHTWKALLLENTILSQLTFALSAREATISQSNETIKAEKDRVRIAKEVRLNNSEQRFSRATLRAARGEIRIDTLAQYLIKLDQSRSDIDQPDNTNSNDILEHWDDLDINQQRMFLQKHMNRIVVADTKVELGI